MKNYLVSLLLSAAVLFSGCASASSVDKQAVARVAVSVATAKVLRNNPDRIDRVIAIASSVRAVAGQEQFDTVSLLMAFVRGQIDMSKLLPEDQVLVTILLDEIQNSLEEKVGKGKLSTDKLLVVGVVAGWVEDTAELMKTQPVKS